MAFSSSSSENNFDRSIRDARITGINDNSDAEPSSAGHNKSDAGPQFDVISWYPKYQTCQKYFLDHAQHDPIVQGFASFINILLPLQREPNPVHAFSGARNNHGKFRMDREFARSSPSPQNSPPVSLVPYIRRLVVTGMDAPQILHGFFGNDWAAGVGPQREQERRNYLFAAKSGGWASVKRDYDMLPLETVPFMQPLREPTDGELNAAEEKWSQWLALEDWMVGSRAPP